MVTWYWSADNLIWRVSIDHNMVSYIKKYKVSQGCMPLSTYYLEDGRHLARLHHRHHRRHRRRAYAPTSNTTSYDNHEKINHGFPLISYMGMGLHLAALRAAGAPLKKDFTRCELFAKVLFGNEVYSTKSTNDKLGMNCSFKTSKPTQGPML